MEKLNLNYTGTSAQSFDPMALAKMKADTINETPGSLTGYECSKCLNRGNIAIPKEDGRLSFRECDCMRIRRCIWKMEKSGLKNIIRLMTFEAYKATEPWQIKIKQGAMAYAEHADGWLLFCGQVGSGKTHLCTAVCRHLLLAGNEVRYMPWRDEIAQLKALSMDSENRYKVLTDLKNAQILYIDDLFKAGRGADGSCNPTGADISLAFEIINYRYINQLSTIVSTEKTPQELMEIDEAIGSRIVEMARGHTYSISKDVRRNYRIRDVEEV